ncbi:MAG: hypothetical protein GXO77_14260 [Calditrichaeota bacterium]|nr:hypothetical protein [Calditrichota bacterium]
MNKKKMNINIFFKLLIFQIVFLILFSCKENDKRHLHEFYGLEIQRKLFLNEYKSQIPFDHKFLDSIYFDLEYNIPDTFSTKDPVIKYIKKNPDLPKFIIRALVEKNVVEFMTMGEMFLARPDILNQIYNQELVIAFPKGAPNQIWIGKPEYFLESQGVFTAGEVYIFENGFLKFLGVI